MRLSYIAKLATMNLRRRKLRSFLTIGGMAIGIAAIVFLVSLGFGLQRLIVSQVTNLEALSILDVSTGASALLKIDDDAVSTFKNIPDVVEVSPSFSVSAQASREASVTDIALFGINPEFSDIENLKPTIGAVFTDSSKAETVISTTAAELLNVTSFQEAIGQTVTFRISIEVPVEPDPNAPPTSIQGPPKTTTENVDIPAKVTGIIDDELTVGYLPIEVLRKAQAKNDYNLARVKVNEREKLTPVRKEIESLGYQVDSIADTVGQIDQIFLVFEIVMAGFGLIAMLVASLGAFNTLTVSLLERTREVGIMKALGTTSKDVYRLFISESFLIGITGGASGLILGYGTGEILNLVINYLAKRYGGQPVDIFYTPLLLVVMVLGIISIVSFVTGVYPARRASKLNPLNALRYE